MFSLENRNILHFGGAGYLGQAINASLSSLGATIVIADKCQAAAAAACEKILARGGKAQARALDVGEEEQIIDVFAWVKRELGSVDGAINATYHTTGKPMMEMTGPEWEQGMHITLTSAFVIGREAGRIMCDQRSGSIVQFGSMYGMVSPDPRLYDSESGVNPVDYGAGKAAILQLVRYQAAMFGPLGVRVNAVVPGPFPNPGVQAANPAFIERLAERTPLRRIGQAPEIAGAVAFLLSDAASYVTGTSICVDGGWTVW